MGESVFWQASLCVRFSEFSVLYRVVNNEVVHRITFDEIAKDRRMLYKFVSLEVPISDFFGGDTFELGRNVECPFHGDSTPSARIFSGDADGIVKLYCYACRRQYSSYDYIRKVLNEDPAMYMRKKFSLTDLGLKAGIFGFTDVYVSAIARQGTEGNVKRCWRDIERELMDKGLMTVLSGYYNLTEKNKIIGELKK